MTPFTALVLAGRRGPADALAEATGESHRALLEVGGVPMLVRVVRALQHARCVDGIWVSIDEPRALEASRELAEWIEAGEITPHRSLDSPSRSVSDALDRIGPEAPVLVTTADHALLTPEMLDWFAEEAARSGADLVVGAVAASRFRAAFPSARRTFIPLRGDAYSGANLFAFRTPRARRAAAFWVRAERFRKRPWRLVGAFGPVTLLLFGLRRLDLDAALERVSRTIGARVRAALLPFPEAAIDVDRPSDLELASKLLAARESSA